MPTPIEINKPHLTYCQRHDIHCPCPKCKSPTLYCYPTILTRMKMAVRFKECRGCKEPEDVIDGIAQCAALQYKESIKKDAVNANLN